MSNTNDLVTSALTESLEDFKQHFSGLLAERSVDFLSARTTEFSRGLVTECACGCDDDLEEVTKLHPDTHKIKKTKYGYQLFVYSTSTGKFIAQGSPHKTKRAAEKDAKKFESFELDEATKWKMGDGRPRGGARIENVRFWNLPKDQLQYIIKDAGEAMRANPKARKATTGPGNWADQVNDASTVLAWRKKNNIKESVELDEAVKSVDQKIAIDVYSKLKKGDKVKVNFGNSFSMNSKPIELLVTSPHRIVGKSKVGRIILKNPNNMGGMKYTLYNRDGKVSLAQGDMGTVLKGIEIIKESVELDEATLKFDSGMSGESNIQAIVESASTKMPVDIDIDGNNIHVTPDVSERIARLHDELNESNKKDMINMLSDTSSFLKLVKFTQER